MPYTDMTVTPAICILSEREVKELPLLKEAPIVEGGREFGPDFSVVGPKYILEDLQCHTHRMMQLLMINYKCPDNYPKFENIREDIREKIRPLAIFLAIIDGNYYEETIDQYIPQVYAILTNRDFVFIDEAIKNIFGTK